MHLSNVFIFFAEDSKPEPDNPSNENMDANRVSSGCDQSTQTEEVVDLFKKPSEVDTTNEEGLTNPLPDETDV